MSLPKLPGQKIGLGLLSILKTEGQQVAAGTGAVCVAGSVVYFAYLASSAHWLPSPAADPALS